MNPAASRKGHALTIGLALLTFALAVAATVLTMPTLPTPAAVPSMDLPPTPAELRSRLTQLGLDAEALAAAGVAAQSVPGIVADLSDYLEENLQDLAAAEAARGAAQTEHDRVARLLHSGTATNADLEDLLAARDALEASTTQCESLVQEALMAATATLPAEQRRLLATVRANRTRELPVRYLMESRSDAEWMALRDALTVRKISQRLGEAENTDASAVLLQADSSSAAATAAANLEANGAGVRAAWDEATGS